MKLKSMFSKRIHTQGLHFIYIPFWKEQIYHISGFQGLDIKGVIAVVHNGKFQDNENILFLDSDGCYMAI
jgi:hypothetical protein